MCLDELDFALCIVEETCVLATIENHLTSNSGLEQNRWICIEDSFGRAEGFDEVASSDGAYAADSAED